ncbi:pilus assembly PilX N-terminal domain-containing protein [Deefgea tanakiae]|uniref:Pilus assembly PilX N-terminal domain-containing protein n=1 Tax=Deefgea tanakiae TaxID=2865840 RepID=A0ABX8Z3S8_9NEIS|nr:pilus assembly PilX N-terminal domain-containing protein [Deefgea tanakiae]QZA76445.1 pilus assembly PilX N-terminal domain-containing protein [Deefgea tanakiae]
MQSTSCKHRSISYQRGVAALIVTIMLGLIATLGAFYAQRSSDLTQKSSSNSYQNVAALQAAESGADAFIQLIQADLATLATAAPPPATQPATNILVKTWGAGGATTSCALSGGTLNVPYEFKASLKGTDPKEFDSAKYVQNIVAPVATISGVAQGIGWRAQAKIANGYLYIKSEGCVGNTGTVGDGNVCADTSLATAVVRRSIKMNGSIAPSNNALTIRKHIDTRTTLNISKKSTSVAPACGVMYGDGGAGGTCNPATDAKGCLSLLAFPSFTDVGKKAELDATVMALNDENYFKSFSGNLSTAEFKAMSGTPVTNCTQAAAVPASQKFIWWEGNLSAVCTFPVGKFIVINGDVTSPMTAQGESFVYVTGNVYQNGAMTIEGSAAVAGIWDVGPLGVDPAISGHPGLNGKTDALGALAHTHTSAGSLTISYVKTSFDLPTSSVTTTTGSWIDF